MNGFVKRFGFSLTEVSVTILLLAIMFSTCYRFMRAEQRAIQTTRQSTLAIYALETLRNRVLADLATGGTFDLQKVRGYIKDFRLPYRISVQQTPVSLGSNSKPILRLEMLVRPTAGSSGRSYTREIEFP